MTAVDTNVLIYACDKGDALRQRIALDLISSIVDGVLPCQPGCEFIAVLPLAQELHLKHSVSFWDALVVATQISGHYYCTVSRMSALGGPRPHIE
jgi:predicted nucleic acid-binding protein